MVTEEMIEKWLSEDVPYVDLTTHLLGIGGQIGTISFKTRDTTVLSGIDVVKRIFNKKQIEIVSVMNSGDRVEGDTVFLVGKGYVKDLHQVWRITQNIFEYTCGISTRTRNMLDDIHRKNSKIQLATTRKIFPGTKTLSIQASMDGGAYPHRLGLSETILVFKNHLAFMGGYDGFLDQFEMMKSKAGEKAILIEVDTLEEAKYLVEAGIESIQIDKMDIESLTAAIKILKSINPRVKITATGGINGKTAKDYATTGADIINTSWVYFGKPADIKVTINSIE